MPWDSSSRRSPLPSDWRAIRAPILRRDPTCRLRLEGCTVVSTEVDHVGDPDDHRPHMLRGVCRECHQKRTQAQAAAARPSARRLAEKHPGLRS